MLTPGIGGGVTPAVFARCDTRSNIAGETPAPLKAELKRRVDC
jgi:hypothetical protein